MTINILDYKGDIFDTGLTTEGVDRIHVTVVTGDEILEVTYKDGTVVTIDAENKSGVGRLMSFYDGEYDVPPEKIELWLKRTGSYDGSWDTEDNESESKEERV